MADAPRRATIIDVAERAGVSRQTVTRAINDMPGISDATRQRVLSAARELSYRPSRFGRGLVEQGPTSLGLLVDDLSNSYFAELGAAFVRAASAQGWNVVMAERINAPRPDEAAAELGRRVDALVGYDVLAAHLRGGQGMPIVALDGGPEQARSAGVIAMDAGPALAELVEHLREQGVRRPVVVDLGEDGAGSRARALADALAPLAPDRAVPVVGADPRDGHEELLARVLFPDGATAPQADALVAFNDELAVRLLRALRQLGVDVPGQVRVVGNDGLELSELVTPELTTLAIDLDEVARETVGLVRGMLEGTVALQGSTATRTVPYRLVRRAST